MDVNPYQPPREPDPLQKKQPIKHAIGLVTILLLTPLAVLIAGGTSCAAGIAIVESFSYQSDFFGVVIALACIVFVAPPLLTLVGMIWWAVRIRKR